MTTLLAQRFPALSEVEPQEAAFLGTGIEIGADSSGTQIDYAQSWLVRPLPDS